MAKIITQAMYDIATQSTVDMQCRISIMNYQLQNIKEISGWITRGSFSCSANSDIRRNISLTIAIGSETGLSISEQGGIWLDKLVQVYIGVKHIQTEDVVWHNFGIYLINNPSTVYSADEYTITIQGVDLMARLTGIRNGQLSDLTTVIPFGSSIRSSIISTLTQLGGFENYRIDEFENIVPEELKFTAGDTVYNILSKLRDFKTNYEMFFDEDGVFIFQQIPSGVSEPVVADEALLLNNVLEVNNEINFEDVKNSIILYGASLEPNYFGGDAVISGSNYQITLSSVSDISDLFKGIMIGFIAPSAISGTSYLEINSLYVFRIVNEDGTDAEIPSDANNTYYVCRVLDETEPTVMFMGTQQIYAVAKDINPDSPYYIYKEIGEINLVLIGGEYDNIYTTSLAQQRANYELWLHSRMNDNIVLTCAPIYFLNEANQKIKWDGNNDGVAEEYLIKEINMGFQNGETQTINAIRYYPLYPEI